MAIASSTVNALFAEERHNVAREIVQSGRPFVLLLRTYAKTMPWPRNLPNEVHDELSPELAVLSSGFQFTKEIA